MQGGNIIGSSEVVQGSGTIRTSNAMQRGTIIGSPEVVQGGGTIRTSNAMQKGTKFKQKKLTTRTLWRGQVVAIIGKSNLY